MLALAGRTIHHRDLVGLCPGTQTAAESSRHAHQMIVVQLVIGTAQCTPPHAQSSAGLAHREVCVQNHPIDAIITAFEKIAVEGAQLVRHCFRSVTATCLSPQPLTESCPAGATISRRSPRKSVATFRRKIQEAPEGSIRLAWLRK